MFRFVVLWVAVLLIGIPFYGNDKTLVIILGQTRAHELTYQNIKENLIDTLGADLAVCIGAPENYPYDNPFYQNAKYKFLYDEPSDFGSAFDYAYENILRETFPIPSTWLHWREFLKIRDQFLGGILDRRYQHPGSAGILIFFRWFLLKNLLENNLLDEYDFFVITRSDYIYRLPHPRVELLSKDRIYIPDAEHCGGVTDRHVILPKKFVVTYLNMLNTMVSKGTEYYEKMKSWQPMNLEKFIKFHLMENDVFQFVRYFPYVMYAVRPINGTTRWSVGQYSKEHDYFIKYASEYEISQRHKADFDREKCSIDDFYRKRIKK